MEKTIFAVRRKVSERGRKGIEGCKELETERLRKGPQSRSWEKEMSLFSGEGRGEYRKVMTIEVDHQMGKNYSQDLSFGGEVPVTYRKKTQNRSGKPPPSSRWGEGERYRRRDSLDTRYQDRTIDASWSREGVKPVS